MCLLVSGQVEWGHLPRSWRSSEPVSVDPVASCTSVLRIWGRDTQAGMKSCLKGTRSHGPASAFQSLPRQCVI